MTRLMYLDASSLAYRAFFSVPKTIKDDSGQPVNAVRGFMDMAARLKTDHEPDQLIAVFDNDWRPAFRVHSYPGYKAERADEPEELTPQFEMLAQVLDLAGIARAGADGFEADDVIATYAVAVGGEDRALVVTGDRDLLCLVRDPFVELLFPVKGVTELKRFDETAVREAYGVPASLYSEFATLRGDSSDGLPGIKGVGPKTASKLLADHGSIAGIYEHLEELTPRVKGAFEEARSYIESMKLVVPPRTDCKIQATPGKEPNETELKAFAAAHNLDGPVTRLLAALGAG